MLSLDGAISPIADFFIADVGLVMSVDTLAGPLVIFGGCEVLECFTEAVRTNNSGTDVISVVLEYEAAGEVSPGGCHFIIIYYSNLQK
jgi:hypothetical protein